MKPALSIILFTTLAGAGQGLVCLLALAQLAGAPGMDAALLPGLVVAWLLLGAGLVASFFHVGNVVRAWRAVLMWRTSWLSREVIALPLFMAMVALWAIAVSRQEAPWRAFPWALLALAMSLALWLCTGMIYACLRFIQEWAHPYTVINFVLIGLASGGVIAGALAAALGSRAMANAAWPWAVALFLLAWAWRWLSLRRNDGLRPKSDIRSATGIAGTKVVQRSMGFSGGSFNTREFFHHAPARLLRHMRLGFQVGAFALPAAVLACAALLGQAHLPAVWGAALAMHLPGVLAERWYFFAQARHPQNLYYQTVA